MKANRAGVLFAGLCSNVPRKAASFQQKFTKKVSRMKKPVQPKIIFKANTKLPVGAKKAQSVKTEKKHPSGAANLVLSVLAVLAVLLAAAALVFVPFHLMRLQQNQRYVDVVQQNAFTDESQNTRLAEDPLASSLCRHKQHALLAGETDTAADEIPEKSLSELLQRTQEFSEAVIDGTSLPRPEQSGDVVYSSGNGFWYGYPGYYMEIETGNAIGIIWDTETGKAVAIGFTLNEPLSEAETLLQDMQSGSLSLQLTEKYIAYLGYQQQDFSALEKTPDLENKLETESVDTADYTLMYSSSYQIYLSCMVRETTYLDGLYLECYFSVCSLTQDELQKVVSG